MGNLAGRAALVTGGSRGIGAAIVRRLAADGAAVAFTYRSEAEAAGRLVSEIENGGGQAFALQADLANPIEARSVVRKASEQVGRLDIVVNNAGMYEAEPVDRIDEAHFDRVFALNVRAPLLVTREAVGAMQSGGRIIMISSGAGEANPPGMAVYNASKAALNSVTRTLAAEMGPGGITVNAVAPGFTATEMALANFPEAQLRAIAESTPLRRIGTPQDVADVVAFLASDEARWVTGQVIAASGGFR